jgi:hypothetical protein
MCSDVVLYRTYTLSLEAEAQARARCAADKVGVLQ